MIKAISHREVAQEYYGSRDITGWRLDAILTRLASAGHRTSAFKRKDYAVPNRS